MHAAAVERLKDWTRARFSLGEEDTVVVQENACALPGFPPEETLVVFWTGDNTRHHFKVFRPVEQVLEADVPPSWMREALAAVQGLECSCCA
jgi:hypothetical protein